jgi:hypothetical protein
MFFRGACGFGLLLAGGRLRLTLGLAVASLVVLGIDAGPALAKTKSFTSAGCSTWTVPAGVSSVQITATGSAGQGAAGGTGDVVSGTLSRLSSGHVLDLCVDYGGGAAGAGSLQNGGAGGGASGVGLGSDFSTPVLIAGGGGGSASNNGGSLTDSGGNAGLPSGGGGGSVNGDGGGGGTQTTFGTGGAADPSCGGTCTGGANGAGFTSAGPGTGGAGGGGFDGGGGGGGGYYGGGGGGGSELLPGGGGGGGSDFCASSLAAPFSLSGCRVTGTNATYGTASVMLTYTQAAWAHDFRDLVVDSRGLGPGAGHTLVHKVKLARSKYMTGDVSGACRTLDGYIREVNKQTGATITKAQARDLIEDAHETQKAIGCSSR